MRVFFKLILIAFLFQNNIQGHACNESKAYEVIACHMEPSNTKSKGRHIAAIKCRSTLLDEEYIFTVPTVVQKIEKEGYKFFTLKNKKKAYIEVIKPRGRNPYIRTIPDQEKGNNLLSLPTF